MRAGLSRPDPFRGPGQARAASLRSCPPDLGLNSRLNSGTTEAEGVAAEVGVSLETER
jgi:hypothetical protein